MAIVPRKIVVFGGNGFVGSRIVTHALQRGHHVVVACRSAPTLAEGDPDTQRITAGGVGGAKPGSNLTGGALSLRLAQRLDEQGLGGKLQWVPVDALDRQAVEKVICEDHADATAVITTIGLLSVNHKHCRRIAGDTNVNIAAAVYKAPPTVEKLVFVSAARNGLPLLEKKILKGYFQGKEIVEKACQETLPERSAILRPAMVSGWRETNSGYWVPIPSVANLFMTPIHKMTGLRLFTPSSDVDDLAKAALQCALNTSSAPAVQEQSDPHWRGAPKLLQDSVLATAESETVTPLHPLGYDAIRVMAARWDQHYNEKEMAEHRTAQSETTSVDEQRSTASETENKG